MENQMKKYCMNEIKNGIVVLLSDTLDPDMYKLQSTFVCNNFQTLMFIDKNKREIKKHIDEGINNFIKTPSNSFIVVISGDINNKGFLLASSEEYSLHSIQEQLCRKELFGVPKIFIIQAKRGNREDKGIFTDGPCRREVATFAIQIRQYTLPMQADFLIMYSCCDGYQSLKDVHFIETLNNELKSYISNTDLLSIFTEVSRKIALTKIPSGLKQMPMIHSRLTGLLSFNQSNANSTLQLRTYNIDNKKISVIMFNHLKYTQEAVNSFNDNEGIITERENLNEMTDLSKTFKEMGLNVELRLDSNRNEILDILKTKATDTDCDGVIVVISTHGKMNKILVHDGMIHIYELFEIFKGKLIGKPKIFLINACRGCQGGQGVGNIFKDKINITESDEVDTCQSTETATDNESKNLPETADFFISYSTSDGNLSFIDGKKIFYLNKLSEVLNAYKDKPKDLRSMLTIVHERVATECETGATGVKQTSNKKQMPCFDSTLTKSFIFNPVN